MSIRIQGAKPVRIRIQGAKPMLIRIRMLVELCGNKNLNSYMINTVYQYFMWVPVSNSSL